MGLFLSNKIAPTRKKLRGAYYTPNAIADFMSSWVLRGERASILEPSCGDGVFVQALVQLGREKNLQPSITAIDIEAHELSKARTRVNSLVRSGTTTWINEDFFQAFTGLEKSFDAVIGNPPFIRFQHFEHASRERAFNLLRTFGYHPTKLSNAWVAFVQLSAELLKDGGRLAMIVPAEILQVTYAAELRARLARIFSHIIIVGFDRLVFPDIQQEVVILLADGKRDASIESSAIDTLQLSGPGDLTQFGILERRTSHAASKHGRSGMKWTALFLEDELYQTLEAVQRNERLLRLGDYASVDVGIVTGRNSFFVLTDEEVHDMGIRDFVVPIIGRSSALASVLFNSDDWKIWRKANSCYLLDLTNRSEKEFPTALRRYILEGEEHGVSAGYKCRIRRRWFDVPSIYKADAFLLRQIHSQPLLSFNATRATCTDTLHRIRFKAAIDGKALAAAFRNSLTVAWAEVCGRSYGGGVLELEPREAEELPILAELGQIDTEKVDALLRSDRQSEALEYIDRIVLRDALGLETEDIARLRLAASNLRERRRRRRTLQRD